MIRSGYGVKSYETAHSFLQGHLIFKIDEHCVLVNSLNSLIFVLLDGNEIVKYYKAGRIEINNHKQYNLRYKRYISEFSPVKLTQKEWQWYLGEQIFFSQMRFEDGVWKKL